MDKDTKNARSPELKAFIRKNSHLFWYTPDDKKEDISDEMLVEFILNYGTLEAVKELFQLLGLRETAEIYRNTINLSERRRNNFSELTRNFFNIYFDRHVPRNLN